MTPFTEWCASALIAVLRRPLGLDRLEYLDLVQLGVPIEDAIALYGEAFEIEDHETVSGAKEYSFAAGHYHAARLVEWKGVVHSATYSSERATRPIDDLKHALDFYGEDIGWNELTAGYSYARKDEERRLFCSAMPIIGIHTEEYIAADVAGKADER